MGKLLKLVEHLRAVAIQRMRESRSMRKRSQASDEPHDKRLLDEIKTLDESLEGMTVPEMIWQSIITGPLGAWINFDQQLPQIPEELDDKDQFESVECAKDNDTPAAEPPTKKHKPSEPTEPTGSEEVVDVLSTSTTTEQSSNQ